MDGGFFVPSSLCWCSISEGKKPTPDPRAREIIFHIGRLKKLFLFENKHQLENFSNPFANNRM